MTIDWQIETFDTVSSTMDLARERGEAGAAEGVVIVARNQTQGRGRQGNIWIAKPGNLYFSLILRSIHARDAGQYSYLAAIALADTVMPCLKDGFIYQHKWPNDGLINHLKFAGILPHLGQTEKTGEDFLNLGVGINIEDAPEGKFFFNAAAMQKIDAAQFLALYLQNLELRLVEYRRQGFGPVRKAWLDNARGLGECISVRMPNQTINGVFNGLDGEGGLLLGLDNGTQKVIRSGEVYFGNET